MSDHEYDFDLAPLVRNALFILRAAMAGNRSANATILGLCQPGRPDQLTADVAVPWDWKAGPGLAQVDLCAPMAELSRAVPPGYEITNRVGWFREEAKKSAGPVPTPLQLPIGPPAAAYVEHDGVGLRGIIHEIAAPNHPNAVVMPFYDINFDGMVLTGVIPVLRFDVRIRPIKETTHEEDHPSQASRPEPDAARPVQEAADRQAGGQHQEVGQEVGVARSSRNSEQRRRSWPTRGRPSAKWTAARSSAASRTR